MCVKLRLAISLNVISIRSLVRIILPFFSFSGYPSEFLFLFRLFSISAIECLHRTKDVLEYMVSAQRLCLTGITIKFVEPVGAIPVPLLLLVRFVQSRLRNCGRNFLNVYIEPLRLNLLSLRFLLRRLLLKVLLLLMNPRLLLKVLVRFVFLVVVVQHRLPLPQGRQKIPVAASLKAI